jgi:hypothetical protein
MVTLFSMQTEAESKLFKLTAIICLNSKKDLPINRSSNLQF